MMQPLTLCLIVPVRNDTALLCRLLAQAAGMACFDQIVVVDDASDTPITSAEVCPATLPEGKLTLIRQDTQQGPGPARNRALDYVETTHLIYVDADDLLTPELPDLLADLSVYGQGSNGQEFDLCLFKYADSRVAENGSYGQMPYDEKIWRSAGAAVGALRSLPRDQTATLTQIGSYPWNKIYRSDFLRSSGARCSDILVHEDIALHWESLLRAKNVLTSDRVIVTHFVAATGARLTNLRSAERLKVFGPLAEIAEELRAPENAVFRLPFLRFCTDFFGWVAGNVVPDLLPDLNRRAADFLTDLQTLDGLEDLSRIDPKLAERVADLTARADTDEVQP